MLKEKVVGNKKMDNDNLELEGPPFRILPALILFILACAFSSVFIFYRDTIRRIFVNSKLSIIEENLEVDESLNEDFISHIRLLVNSQESLKAEFEHLEELSKKIPFSETVAMQPENKGLNRYTNILPCDETRVLLRGEDNDYINASHIQLQNGNSVQYLACQAPKEAGCERFWKMLIQNNVKVIVMLCMPMEKGKQKCFPYFPMVGQVEVYGKIRVHCSTELTYPDYVARYLIVNIKGQDNEQFEFTQLHFTGWPDHGVPTLPESLMYFREAVRQAHGPSRDSVVAVHCSAGVGRTGAFIAVDELLTLLSSDCRLDVLQTVLGLRRQRHRLMVQTESQYEYIYKCLHYAIENPLFPVVKVDDTRDSCFYENVEMLKLGMILPEEVEQAV